MAGVLIYSNKANLALELQSAATVIAQGRSIKTLLINDSYDVAELDSKAAVYVNKQEGLCMSDVGAIAATIKEAAQQLDCDILLLSSDRRGKELVGRLAQKLNSGCVTDVSSLKVEGDKIVATRNALGGAVVAEQSINSDIKIFALAPKSYPVPESASGHAGVEEISITVPLSKLSFISAQPKATDSVDISAAEILIAVGLGVEEQNALPDVEAIAKALKGEVACSKPLATDKKWFPEDRIIGISGKTCKPQLAILLGISGQVQFWAGIRDAKIIAAVNIDENCGIMSMVDYSLAADVKEFIPAFLNQLA